MVVLAFSVFQFIPTPWLVFIWAVGSTVLLMALGAALWLTGRFLWRFVRRGI